MKKIFLHSIVVGFFFANLTPSYAHWTDSGDWGMHGPGMMGWGYGMGWFGMILMAVFWIAIIVAIIFLIRWLVSAGGGRGRQPEDSALEILKKRYARDEISKEEFEEKKKNLM